MLNQFQKHSVFLIIFFGFIAISLFSPIASNEYLPNSVNFSNHVASIVQAKQALEEGQFPVRIEPSSYEGQRYPHFQFYSPFVYTIAGLIYKWVTPANPFIAFKIMIWLALVFAGIFTFHFITEFISSRKVALLAAVVYMMSPYLILDIGVRGDLTESIAACLLPCVLYYSIKCARKPTLRLLALTSFVWGVLATIHIITFVFSSIFIGIFLVCLNIQEKSPLKNLMLVCLAYAVGWMLSMWYLAPVIFLQPILYSHYILNNPYHFNWLSPLATLMSPAAVSPMPLGDSRLPVSFYVGIGWPVLLSVGYAMYAKRQSFITSLLVLFFSALFLAWSPLNFWIFLPEPFHVVQYGCRFLIQIMWIGTLLFAWTLHSLSQETFDMRYVLIGILLVGLSSGSWLQANPKNEKSIQELVSQPSLYEWGAKAFVVSPLLFKQEISSPLFKAQKNCQQNGTVTNCEIKVPDKTNWTQLPILYYPKMLEVKVDGQKKSYEATAQTEVHNDVTIINPMLVSLQLTPGAHSIAIRFIGFAWANVLSLVTFLVLIFFLVANFFWNNKKWKTQ